MLVPNRFFEFLMKRTDALVFDVQLIAAFLFTLPIVIGPLAAFLAGCAVGDIEYPRTQQRAKDGSTGEVGVFEDMCEEIGGGISQIDRCHVGSRSSQVNQTNRKKHARAGRRLQITPVSVSPRSLTTDYTDATDCFTDLL